MTERLTPQRREEIIARLEHSKFSKFGSAREVIMELLAEIDALEAELSDTKDNSLVYQKFQNIQKDRDRLRTVLKTEIKNENVKKVFFGGDEK